MLPEEASPADLDCTASVLGVPVRFETNAREILDLISDAYGPALSPADPHIVSPRVRIIADPSLDAGDEAPVSHLPEPDLLVLQLGSGRGRADAARGEAVAHVSPASVVRPVFREGVLDHLTLFLVTKLDRYPLHAAAIARDGAALVIAGPSGLGKSSITYAAMREGFQILTDDVVFIQKDAGARLWSLPPRIHLPREATRHFPELDGAEITKRPDGRSKILVRVPPAMRAPVPWIGDVGLCLLVASDVDRAPQRVSAVDAMAELRASLQGGFHRFARTLDDYVGLVARHGCWRVPVTTHPSRLVERVAALLTEQRA